MTHPTNELRRKRKKHGRTSRVRRRRAGETPLRPVPDTSPEIISLMRFLKARGFVNSTGLQPVLYQGVGRGLRSKRRSMAAESTVMSLPLSCLLLPSTIRQSNPALYSRAREDDEVLAHFLYSQRRALDRGEPAEWAPYIRTLPQSYQRLLPVMAMITADEDTRDQLNEHLPHSFRIMLADYQINFQRLLQAVQALLFEEPLEEELLWWVFNVMHTRSLSLLDDQEDAALSASGKDSMALAPFFDLTNHCPFASASTRVCPETGLFQFTFHEPVKRGAQLLIDYESSDTNREFFLHYGFIHILPPLSHSDGQSTTSTTFDLVPSPMDFFKLSFQQLRSLLSEFVHSHLFCESSHCYRMAATRMGQRMKSRMGKSGALNGLKQKFLYLLWPAQLCKRKELQYVVSLRQDRSYGIFNLSDCSPVADQLTYGRYLSGDLDILLSLLSVRHLPQEERVLEVLYQKMTRKFDVNPNEEGPLGELNSPDERLLFYHMQLVIIEWLLWDRFRSKRMSSLELLKVENPVELLNGYLTTLQQVPGMPDQLAQLFTNEMALLIFLRQHVSKKCRPLRKSLEAEGGGHLKCTCEF